MHILLKSVMHHGLVYSYHASAWWCHDDIDGKHKQSIVFPSSVKWKLLQPRLAAHSCLRGHIWLVTIRTSVVNQADVAIMCFWLKCAPFKQWIWIKCAPWNMEDKYKCIFWSWFTLTQSLITHFYREFRFVAITRFLGGHFGPKFAGTQTFLRTGKGGKRWGG